MNHLNPLTCTPPIDSLLQASERASLSLLAAAALCAKNALLAEHRDELTAMGSDDYQDQVPPAVTLAATRVIDHINDLTDALLQYEASLRDHLQARLYRDYPF